MPVHLRWPQSVYHPRLADDQKLGKSRTHAPGYSACEFNAVKRILQSGVTVMSHTSGESDRFRELTYVKRTLRWSPRNRAHAFPHGSWNLECRFFTSCVVLSGAGYIHAISIGSQRESLSGMHRGRGRVQFRHDLRIGSSRSISSSGVPIQRAVRIKRNKGNFTPDLKSACRSLRGFGVACRRIDHMGIPTWDCGSTVTFAGHVQAGTVLYGSCF